VIRFGGRLGRAAGMNQELKPRLRTDKIRSKVQRCSPANRRTTK